MEIVFLVAAIAAVVIAFYLVLSRFLSPRPAARRAPATGKGQGAQSDRTDTRWRAVRVAPGLMSCKQAQAVKNRIFLARLAPPLPLAGCTQSECSCKYLHMEDRRSGGDRRAMLGEFDGHMSFNRQERRRSPGRRAEDLVT